MAVSQVDIASPAGLKKYRNTDLDETASAIDSGGGTLHSLVIDNSANAAITFVKLWNAASGSVTVGTTAPDFCIPIPASVKKTIVFFEGIAYATALTIAAVTTAGTAGTTGPSSAVVAEAIYE